MSSRIDPRPAGPHRGHRRGLAKLCDRYGRVRPGSGRPGEAGNRQRPIPRATARNPDCGQGPLLHAGHAHHGRDQGSGGPGSGFRFHRGSQVQIRRRDSAGQVEPDRGSDGRLQPRPPDSAQPLGARPLDGGVVERLGRRDRRRTLLRLAGQRHRRLDQVAGRRLRDNRAQAHVGTGEPLRGARPGPIAGPRRADDALNLGLRGGARDYRRRRFQRRYDAARARPGAA